MFFFVLQALARIRAPFRNTVDAKANHGHQHTVVAVHLVRTACLRDGADGQTKQEPINVTQSCSDSVLCG